jgi:hypothetical protein
MKKWGIKPYIIGLLLLSLLHFVYALRTNTYFSVDDFFEIAYFRNHSVLQFVPDFIVHGDINEFTRVIGFVAFASLQKIFGLNHLAFDFALFATHSINLILLFFVVRKLSKNDFVSFFVSVLFNKNYLFYYSNIHENLLATFCILTIFLFLYYPKKFYLAVISFIFALFSKETAVTVPLVLLAISLFYTLDRKNILVLFLISIVFGVYTSYFFITNKILGDNFIYTPTARLIDLFRGYLYFIDLKIIGLSILFVIFTKKYIYLPLLVTVFITLTPASMLVNRREMYYIYMPFMYLMIFFAMMLPKISFKNSIVYLIAFIIFGGRSVLPKIAWQNFPNWQKESMYEVLDRVESGSNDFSDLNLERDAKLMIGSGTTDLFLEARKKYD